MAEAEKKKTNKGLIALTLILALMVAALLGYIFLYRPQADEKAAQAVQAAIVAEKNAELGIIPGMSDEDIEARLNQKVAEGMLNVACNPNPVFQNGKSEGNLRIENIPGNNYAVTVTVILEDSGTTVYTSGLIDPGYFVENVTLDVPLQKGEYPALAKFTAYDPKTKEEAGTAGIRVNILVQN